MCCGECGQVWAVDLAWMEQWVRRDEACPHCGTTCESENAARVTVSEDDPASDAVTALQLEWYQHLHL